MACQELQRGETLATLKKESDNLKKKLEVERGKLNDVERKCLQKYQSTTHFYLHGVYWKLYQKANSSSLQHETLANSCCFGWMMLPVIKLRSLTVKTLGL